MGRLLAVSGSPGPSVVRQSGTAQNSRRHLDRWLRSHAGYAEDTLFVLLTQLFTIGFGLAAGRRPLSIGTKTIWNSPHPNSSSTAPVYWRVEGSLADLTTVRPVAFFTWNAQTFLERWVRRGMVLVMAVLRPFLYAANRIFATRVVHTVLRGISRDRLDLLGEEYFKYKLQPYLKADGMELLKSRMEAGDEIVLVSQGLEHVMRPLAQHLGVKWLIANRLEFRDGIATGRLLEPVIRPRGLFAGINGAGSDGRRAAERLVHDLGLDSWKVLRVGRSSSFASTSRLADRPIVYFDGVRHLGPLSVRKAFSGKHVMLIGVTGFIGKVWLVNTLMELPEIGRIYLLIRRQKSNPAQRRFEKLVEESPVFDPLYARYGAGSRPISAGTG